MTCAWLGTLYCYLDEDGLALPGSLFVQRCDAVLLCCLPHPAANEAVFLGPREAA